MYTNITYVQERIGLAGSSFGTESVGVKLRDSRDVTSGRYLQRH